MRKHVTKIYGPPGTGKTTALLAMVNAEPGPREEIAMVTFRKTAAQEMLDRLGVTKETMPWAGTIDALATRALKRSGLVMKPATEKHRRLFAQSIGSAEDATQMFRVFDFAVNTEQAPERYPHWPWFQEGTTLPWSVLSHLHQRWERWKTANDVYDFHEIRSEAIGLGPLPLSCLYVDESADCQPQMWRLLMRLTHPTTRIVLIGDDDQSIDGWAGASGSQFVSFRSDVTTTLSQSYRVPRRVKEAAESIVQRVSFRAPKTYHPRDAEGSIHRMADMRDLNCSHGTWLLLARTNREAAQWASMLMDRGLNFRHLNHEEEHHFPREAFHLLSTYERLRAGQSVGRLAVAAMRRKLDPETPRRDTLSPGDTLAWVDVFPHDRAVAPAWSHPSVFRFTARVIHRLKTLRAHGELQGDPNRIRVSTIHAAKGLEAEHVGLLAHQSRATTRRLQGNRPLADEEHRTWYVAVTRASESVTLVVDPTWPY